MDRIEKKRLAHGDATRGGRVWAERVLIVGFLLLVGWPAAGLLVSGESSLDDRAEKRRLAAWPTLTWERKSLVSFPVRFDAFFQDHFALRRRLIRWNNLVSVHWLGMTPSSVAGGQVAGAARASVEVLAGKQDWLFFTGGSALDDYRCVRPFTVKQIDAWVATLEARRQWLNERGIEYLLVVPPNKHSVYEEYLPRAINRLGNASRFEQLLAGLKQVDDFPVLDLRDPLRDAKQVERCYHKTDTHWNDFGAWVGYREMMRRLSGGREDLQPWSLERFELVKTDRAGGDLAMMLGLQDLLREEWYDLVPKSGERRSKVVEQRQSAYECLVTEHPDATLPRAVIFRDSFFNALQPMVSEHFSRATYAWTYDFDVELIERERPQFVVQEIIERSFMGIRPENPAQMDRVGAELAHGKTRTDTAPRPPLRR